MKREVYPESIKVSFSPYTYVRVMAMKGKLYRKHDYDKLLKMHGNEIAKYLQESEYKEDINELSKQWEGYALVEQAVYANFVKNIQKLQKISTPEMQLLLKAYLKKYDIYNIKTILRAKAAGQKKEETIKLLLPIGTFTKQTLQTLLELDSLEAILKKTGLKEQEYKEALIYYNNEKSLLEIENLLDENWYGFLQKFLNRLAGDHKLFKELLQAEIDVMNVKLLMRLKKTGKDTGKATSLFFKGGKLFSKSKLDVLFQKDFEGIIAMLKTTPLKHVIEHYQDEITQRDFRMFEKSLDVWLLQKATLLLHQFPLSVDTLLGYMIAKEIEMRNVRILVKGKQLQIDEKIIASQLVIA